MAKLIKDSDPSILYRCNQKYFDKALLEYGLGYSNLIFLLQIYENEGISLNKLANDGAFDKGTITKSIQKLENMNLVISKVNENDKRSRLLYTSEKANSIIPKLYLLKKEWEEYLYKDIDINELEEYSNTLAKVINKARLYSEHEESETLKVYGFDKLSLNDYKSKVCSVIYTGGCNFKCPYCDKKNLVFLNNETSEIDLDEINDYLDKRVKDIEGICISGGEPLIQKGLKDFIKGLKERKLLVKINTNGSNYKLLKELVEEKLVDYISLDIKNSKALYSKTVGLDNYDISDIEKTLKYLKEDHVKYELRLTLCREFHEDTNFNDLGKWLKGSKRLTITNFIDNGNCIKDGLHPFEESKLKEVKEVLSTYIEEVDID